MQNPLYIGISNVERPATTTVLSNANIFVSTLLQAVCSWPAEGKQMCSTTTFTSTHYPGIPLETHILAVLNGNHHENVGSAGLAYVFRSLFDDEAASPCPGLIGIRAYALGLILAAN